MTKTPSTTTQPPHMVIGLLDQSADCLKMSFRPIDWRTFACDRHHHAGVFGDTRQRSTDVRVLACMLSHVFAGYYPKVLEYAAKTLDKGVQVPGQFGSMFEVIHVSWTDGTDDDFDVEHHHHTHDHVGT